MKVSVSREIKKYILPNIIKRLRKGQDENFHELYSNENVNNCYPACVYSVV